MTEVDYGAIVDALLAIPNADEEEPTPDRSGVEPNQEVRDDADA
jgi:hypothetical protein